MSAGGGHEHDPSGDPFDRDKERKEALDEASRVNAARRGWPSHEVQARMDGLNRAVSSVGLRDAVVRADAVSTGDRSPAATFADSGNLTAYTQLRARAQDAARSATLLRRKEGRRDLLATEMSYVAPDPTDPSSDAVFAALADVGDSPNISNPATAPARAMLAAWQESSPRGRYAERSTQCVDIHLDSPDLDLPVAQAHATEKLSQDDPPLWDSGTAMLAVVESVIEGQETDEPIDLSALYARVGEVQLDGENLSLSGEAQVAGLALGALRGDGRQVPQIQNDALHALAGVAELSQSTDLTALRAVEPTLGLSSRQAVRPARIARASEFDLSRTWRHLFARARADLLTQPDGTARAQALDLAVPATLGDALENWCTLRRDQAAPGDLLKAAQAVAIALEDARAELTTALGDPNDLPALRGRAVEYGILVNLLSGYSGEFIRQARSTARGQDARGGRFDGLRALLEMDTAAAQARFGERQMTNADLNSPIGSTGWAQDLAKAYNRWRSHKVEFTQERRLINVTSDMQQFLAAVTAAQPSIDALSPSDRREWTTAVSGTLLRMAEHLRAVGRLDTPISRDPAFIALLGRLDTATQVPTAAENLDALWTRRSSELIRLLTQVNLKPPEFASQLGPKLIEWRTATSSTPADLDRVEEAGYAVMDVLNTYRLEARTISDPDIVASYEDLFDLIANTMSSVLANPTFR